MAEEYLVLSLKWSGQHGDRYATWWRPNSNGYVWSIDHAGVYTKEKAESYNDTLAVPKKLALELSVVDNFEKQEAHYLPMDKVEELIKTVNQA